MFATIGKAALAVLALLILSGCVAMHDGPGYYAAVPGDYPPAPVYYAAPPVAYGPSVYYAPSVRIGGSGGGRGHGTHRRGHRR